MASWESMSVVLGDFQHRARAANSGEPLVSASRNTRVSLDSPRSMSDAELEADHAELMLRVADMGRQLDDDRDSGMSRGENWRRRAMGARRVHMQRVDLLVAEGQRRGLPFSRGIAGPERPPRVDPAMSFAHAADMQRQHDNRTERQRVRDAALEAERIRAAAKVEGRRIAAEAQEKADARRAEERLRKEEAHREFLARNQKAMEERAAIRREYESIETRAFADAAKDMLGSDACKEIWDRAAEMFPSAFRSRK